MYRVDRNDYFNNVKNSTVFTPPKVSEFLFEILRNDVKHLFSPLILDPCAGEGALLKPWEDAFYPVFGIDLNFKNKFVNHNCNYLDFKNENNLKPAIILINPPFNVDNNLKSWLKENKKGRALLPEVFLEKTVDLFGEDVIIALFTPPGLRLNQNKNSKRREKFLTKNLPEISSIVSLTKDTFSGVLFHSEILLFNTRKTKPHYFYNEDFIGV